MSYLPIPPRVWSRVQNECSVNTSTSNLVFDPLTGQYVTQEEYNKLKQIQIKGNILQYKNNSSNLTKKQKYSQIAKGQWTNRTKTWATQSLTYSNPNTTSLQRVNTSTLAATANTPFVTNTYSITPNPFNCPISSIADIPDGGNLVATITVNPCTNEIIKTTTITNCSLSTDCDVPGPPIALCWNPKLPTYYPKQNLTNNNSTDKWPFNYKGLVSALRLPAPVLNGNSNCSIITISWIYNDYNCLPLTSFNIYLNGFLYKNIPKNITSYTFEETTGTYDIYITALSQTLESEPSNIITLYITPPPSIVLTGTPINNDITKVKLDWTSSNLGCIDLWYLYQNNILINTYPNTTLTDTITGLLPGTTYTFYVKYINNDYISIQSNTITVTPSITNNYETKYGSYTYTIPSNILYYDVTVIGAGGGGGSGFYNSGNSNLGCLGGSGGGGGGIAIKNNVLISTQSQFNYTVGPGGSGGVCGKSQFPTPIPSTNGNNGFDSTFSDGLISITANGGQGGSADNNLYPSGNTTFNLGGTGGSASGGDINGTGGSGGNSGGIGTPSARNFGFNPQASTGSVSTYTDGPGGGGGGGCIYLAGNVNITQYGAAGGNGGNGAAGGSPGLNGNGGSGVGTLGYGGSGGGGVGGNIYAINPGEPTGTGGLGIYGSGGGGGGASNLDNSLGSGGNGGNGGDGVVYFTVYGITIV